MNKQMLLGLVAGIGVATAGGVLGYQYLGQSRVDEQGTAAVDSQEPPVAARPAAASAQNRAATAPRPTQSASAPKPAPAAAPIQVAAAPVEECWDEEVTVEADPKDKHQLAGVGLGAAVGAAVGKDIGHNKLTTAVVAFGGALAGKKIQEKVQENNADKRTTTQTVHKCGPPGSRPQ